MKLPNGRFESLKENGKAKIALIHRHLESAENLKKKIVLEKARDFGVDFNLYGIDFRIRIELKTDCETTSRGELAVYRVHDKWEEGERLEEFPIWSKADYPDLENVRENVFVMYYETDSSCPIECPNRRVSYIEFFSTYFPKLVADAALPIDLDK